LVSEWRRVWRRGVQQENQPQGTHCAGDRKAIGIQNKGGEMKEYTVKVFDSGTRYWYLNGKYHREDGPAIEWADGSNEWWLNGERHRENGPAFDVDGRKEWCLNGKPHREDGPAVELADGTKEWWLNGVEYTEEEFNKKTAKVKELTVAEIESLLGYQIKVVK
jgi:hypothetical protein